MSPPLLPTLRLVAAPVLAIVVSASCAGAGGDGLQVASRPTETAVDDPTPEPVDPTAAGAPTANSAPSAADGGPVATATPDVIASETPRGPNELPVVTVLDVASGAEVSLDSFAPADKPLILWLWAPH